MPMVSGGTDIPGCSHRGTGSLGGAWTVAGRAAPDGTTHRACFSTPASRWNPLPAACPRGYPRRSFRPCPASGASIVAANLPDTIP
jgi:hypothetical protein